MHNDEIHTGFHAPTPSCVDSAYERKAIDDGFLFDPFDLFPENKEYYELKHGLIPVKEWSYNSETNNYEPYVSKKRGP